MIYDAIIVGCGPVGALAANLLGTAGLKTLVVEREADPYPLPRAVHLDHEMMRLFQAAGVIDQVAGQMRDTEGHLHVGSDHGVIRYMGTVGRPRPFGWSNDYFFYQPELEATLRDALGRFPQVDLWLGHEFVSLTQDADQVVVELVHGDETRHVAARWVIGCDGARSAVRKQLGVSLDDLDFEEPWLVVDAEVNGPVRFPDLDGVPDAANLQQLSVMMCDPSRPATIVPGRGNHRRWEFMLLPGEDDARMMQPDKVAELVKPYLGGVDHQITRAATYRFHGLIAERWQVGRVFLAGDAAHQTPPFFGQGMCHGLRDVSNLAWKMAAIVAGEAPDTLLATYQPERDPHVRAVITAAVDAGRYICMLDRDAAAERDATMRARAKTQAVPSTAADLIPPVTAGVVADAPERVGERFIQPKMQGEEVGKLLDAVTGIGWRLFVANADSEARAAGALSKREASFPISVIRADLLADGGAVTIWLNDRDADAVLVRPDFYVFGRTNEDVAALIANADRKMGVANVRTKVSA